MNRSILIVICDFLLLMLLASSRLDQLPSLSSKFPDKPQLGNYSSVPPAAVQPAAANNGISPRAADLLDSMKSSLEEERASREQLNSALSQTEQALREQQRLAAERQTQLEKSESNLRAKEEEARRVAEAKEALASNLQDAQSNLTQIQHQLEATSLEARLSQQRLSSVEKNYAAAQTNLVQLEKQVSASSTEARVARERLAKMENDLRSRQAEAEEARQRILQVEQLRHTAEIEREKIAGKLKVAETETRMTQQQLESAKGQVQTVQKEKAEIQKVATQLAEGVVKFATNEAVLAKEIRENHPLTANTIFADFLTNRVYTDFRANRTGILGRTISRDSQTKTILVTDGTQIYALFHVDDTPFRIEDFGKDWERLFVHLYRGNTILPVPRLQFLSMDPRVVVAPVTDEQAKQLGVHVYKTVTDPFKFQDALIIGADEGYYGECKFTIDARNSGYLKMDRSMLGHLVGKFNPTRGDLVFAKSGDVIGIMVNKQYCALLASFVPTASFPTGSNLSSEAIGARLSAMQGELRALPPEIQ